KVEIPTSIFSQKTNNAATKATPNQTGDRRNNQIVVTGNPAKKAQNFNGYSSLHVRTKVLTVPTSIDARIESRISFGEVDCALPVVGPGTNNKTNRTIPEASPSVPKSNSSRCFAWAISISKSLASSEWGCLSDQPSNADNTSPQTHAITMVTNASARKAQNIALSRRKSRVHPKLLSTVDPECQSIGRSTA